MKQKLPIKFCYKVTDHFYAGEYPFEIKPEDGIAKLKCLTDFGIQTFIDLTDQDGLTPYAEHLSKDCTRLHFPLEDRRHFPITEDWPDFSILKEIHASIDEAIERDEKIYVHCKGGYDRTGLVVATYFIYKKLSPDETKQKFYDVFVPPLRGRYSHEPLIETGWEILWDYRHSLGYWWEGVDVIT